MRLTFYSGGKEKPGGYSGSKIFESDSPHVYICHCGTAAVASPYHKMYNINVYLCNRKLELDYIIYDDHKDYEKIKAILALKIPDNQKALRIARLILKQIKVNDNFDIASFANEIWDEGIAEGKRQKVEEIKKVLS